MQLAHMQAAARSIGTGRRQRSAWPALLGLRGPVFDLDAGELLDLDRHVQGNGTAADPRAHVRLVSADLLAEPLLRAPLVVEPVTEPLASTLRDHTYGCNAFTRSTQA